MPFARLPFRRAAVVLCALLLAACAAPPERGAPPLTPSPDITPNFVVPSVRDRMVFLAQQEWTLFGQPLVRYDASGEGRLEFPAGVTATHEAQGPMLSRVLVYWYAVTRLPIVGYQGELRPWSAAFISWIARSAGLAPDRFPATVLHWDYIERFLAARDGEAFVTRDPASYPPQPGDLVCNVRNSDGAPGFAEAVTDFSRLRRGPYHCDLVVAADSAGIETIGGNVADVVSQSRFPVDARGLVVQDTPRRWVAILESRVR